MLTFHQGGTLMDGTTTPPALRAPGEGVWRHSADNTYAFRIKAFTFNRSERLRWLVDHCWRTIRGCVGRCLYGARNRPSL